MKQARDLGYEQANWSDPEHDRKVRAVIAQLESLSAGDIVSLRKGGASHEVPKFGDRRRHDRKIDVSQLHEILAIDPGRRTCTAEPGVSFDQLLAATLPFGLAPLLVPELKGITVGGAVAGCSVESMSFVYGGFHDSCDEYEVLTGRGERLVLQRGGAGSNLFDMLHGSFGTLGILTGVKFRLVPAKPFVHVTYERHASFDAFREAILRHARAKDYGFIDGFVHSPRDYVLNLGRFVDTVPYHHTYDWLGIYYKSTQTRAEDYLPTRHYYFRYDHGVTNVHPKSFVGRLLFGKLLDSSRLLRLAERFHYFLPRQQPPVTVDLFIPLSHAGEYLRWHEQAYSHYPIWCVPYRHVANYPWIADSFYRGLDDELFLDLAIYGMKQPPGRNAYREIEEILPRVRGLKTLISHNYYAEDEFWRIFNERNYRAAKERMDPDHRFRSLYAKTCKGGLSC